MEEAESERYPPYEFYASRANPGNFRLPQQGLGGRETLRPGPQSFFSGSVTTVCQLVSIQSIGKSNEDYPTAKSAIVGEAGDLGVSLDLGRN